MSKKWARISAMQKRNRKAFWAVLEEYRRRKDKTLLPPLDLSVPRGNVDRLRPTDSDMFADAELSWESKIDDSVLLTRFLVHYLLQEDELSEGEQRTLENKVGMEFIKRRIWPLKEYFNVVKQ
jgi:hypothetical protein